LLEKTKKKKMGQAMARSSLLAQKAHAADFSPAGGGSTLAELLHE
jgi:hypothetical protein